MDKLIIGFTGMAFSLIYRVPQIYKLYKTKSAKDLSIWMIHAQNASYFFYTWYGIVDKDLVYLVSSVLAVVQNIIIMSLRWKYLQDEKKVQKETQSNLSETESKLNLMIDNSIQIKS